MTHCSAALLHDAAVERLAAAFGKCTDTMSRTLELEVRACLEDLIHVHSNDLRTRHAKELQAQKEHFRRTEQLRARRASILRREAQSLQEERFKAVDSDGERLASERELAVTALETRVAEAARTNEERAQDLEVLAMRLREQEKVVGLKVAQLGTRQERITEREQALDKAETLMKTKLLDAEFQMIKVRRSIVPIVHKRITARKQIRSCRLAAWTTAPPGYCTSTKFDEESNYDIHAIKKQRASGENAKAFCKDNPDAEYLLSTDSDLGLSVSQQESIEQADSRAHAIF